MCTIIQANEYSTTDYPFTRADYRVLAVDGVDVDLDGFTAILNKLKAEHDELLRKILFGSEKPPQLQLSIDLSRIADNSRNNTAGWCFLDSPDNQFRELATTYGGWLLSDRARQEEFTYRHEGVSIWRPDPSLELMENFDSITINLALRCLFGAGGSGRGTEFGAQGLILGGGLFNSALLVDSDLRAVLVQELEQPLGAETSKNGEGRPGLAWALTTRRSNAAKMT
ncbi:hypothetical protein C8R44DRAFT_744608 [Mycena epipterygia]|nr:hypothetical protein C8R44DRAFT_744608 [Mycena epipterygia]